MARRWPGLTWGQPLWLFLTARYTETAPQASKEAVKKGIFFSLSVGSVLERVLRYWQGSFQHALQASLPSAVFLPCCAHLPLQAGIFPQWQPLGDCLGEGKHHSIWEIQNPTKNRTVKCWKDLGDDAEIKCQGNYLLKHKFGSFIHTVKLWQINGPPKKKDHLV